MLKDVLIRYNKINKIIKETEKYLYSNITNNQLVLF